MSHKVYVGKQGSILKAQFSPQGLENPVTYVPEVPEWDGETLVRDIPFGQMMFVYVGPTHGPWLACYNIKQSRDDAPAIPIVEPKPLEGEEWDSSLCEKLDRIAEDALKAARAGELKDFPGDEAEEGVTEC